MLRELKITFLVAAVFALASCTSMSSNPAEQILGQWQTQVGNFPMNITYAEQTVQLGNAAPIGYQLEGDQLTYEHGGKQVRIVSFPEASVMQQVDPITGTTHLFSRVSP